MVRQAHHERLFEMIIMKLLTSYISGALALCLSIVFSAHAQPIPTISVRWEHDTQSYQLTDSHLQAWAIFKLYDECFLHQHRLPVGPIFYRYNPDQSVDTRILEPLLEQLVQEVLAGKKRFEHFTVLKDITFNRKLMAGSLVVKFKEYPFVVKLFMENPYSFVHPFQKGWEPYVHFLIAGGVNRHLAGFTRIKNLLHIKKIIAENEEWAAQVDTPRKWYWTPQNPCNLEITGTSFGSADSTTIVIPGLYCIIADAIESEQTPENNFIQNVIAFKKQAAWAMALCNFLKFRIDVNFGNFITERDTHKLVIVDTEHFPTLVGLHYKPINVTSYVVFYTLLVANGLRNILFPHATSGTPFDRDMK